MPDAVDLQHLVADVMGGAVPAELYHGTAGAVLDALFAPENRAALIAEAVNRGVLVAAGAIEPCTEEFRADALAEDIDGETLYRVAPDA